VIKGLLHPDDAREAIHQGADGLIVSNHGGRQLDVAPSPLEMLPLIRAAVGSQVPILLDSGVRRGSDIVMARCLGADSTLFGRPTLYGVAVAGQAGAARALQLMRQEVDMVMTQIGCQDFQALHAGYLWSAPEWRTHEAGLFKSSICETAIASTEHSTPGRG
jgi:(S)-mandelate dehydrogenase